MNDQIIDIREGSINIWIDAKEIDFNDNKITSIIKLNSNNGNILIVKDSDNKLKFFHIFLDKGKTYVEYDVSNLESNIRHSITGAWSIKNREIAIYIDGNKVNKTDIKYAGEEMKTYKWLEKIDYKKLDEIRKKSQEKQIKLQDNEIKDKVIPFSIKMLHTKGYGHDNNKHLSIIQISIDEFDYIDNFAIIWGESYRFGEFVIKFTGAALIVYDYIES